MATLAVSTPARTHAPGAYDRAFYTGFAVLMALTVLVGFGPTYYLRSYFGAPVSITGGTSLSPMAHLHGALFSGWVLLFIVQTGLVAARRVALHRTLGIAGVVLAAAMTAVGVTTAITAAERGSAPPGVDAIAFLAVPLFDMILFSGFVIAAVRMRRNREAHKRLMLLAYVSIITAAVARWPGMVTLGPPGFFGISMGFVALGIAYDRWSRRRVHPVYVWGGALLLLSVPLRLAVSGTAAWRAFAQWAIGLG